MIVFNKKCIVINDNLLLIKIREQDRKAIAQE